MPAIENWLDEPISIINNIFALDQSNFDLKASEYFEDKLKLEKNYYAIPSLNEVPLHELKPNCLVRYRCMIQDSFDPVYYVDRQTLKNKKNKDDVIQTTLKYKESLDVPDGYFVYKASASEMREILQNNDENEDRASLKQRVTFYCVPVPGETDWIKEAYKAKSSQFSAATKPCSSSSNRSIKRTMESETRSEESGHVKLVCHETNEETTVCKICCKYVVHSKDHPEEDVIKTLNISKKTKLVDEVDVNATVAAESVKLNFPLEQNETGHGCLVKVYENFDSYKINDCVEFIGVLVQDPAMAYNYDEHNYLRETSQLIEQVNESDRDFAEKKEETETETKTETITMHIDAPENAMQVESESRESKVDSDYCKCTEMDICVTKSVKHSKQTILSSYPPSLVPRLHCIKAYRLIHNNPLLNRYQCEINEENEKAKDNKSVSEYWNNEYSEFLKSLNCKETLQIENLHLSGSYTKDFYLNKLRNEIIAVFQQLLLGDQLAAEYLLMHFISTVFLRRDVTVLGKFTLNITNIPRSEQELNSEKNAAILKTNKDNANFSQCFYDAIKQISTMTHLFQLTTGNLNKSNLIPSKDYNKDKLMTGMLQLPHDFQLVIDETQLNSGELNQKGLMNFNSLKEIIKWQKMNYDFVYHQQEFNTNMRMLILSHSKSILPFDCQLKLNSTVERFDEDTYRRLSAELLGRDELMSNMRKYFSILNKLEYKLTEKMQKLVEDDIVLIRKNNPNTQTNEKMSVDDIHLLLVVARLQALSYGKKELGVDEWNRAKSLEFERLKQKI